MVMSFYTSQHNKCFTPQRLVFISLPNRGSYVCLLVCLFVCLSVRFYVFKMPLPSSLDTCFIIVCLRALCVMIYIKYSPHLIIKYFSLFLAL